MICLKRQLRYLCKVGFSPFFLPLLLNIYNVSIFRVESVVIYICVFNSNYHHHIINIMSDKFSISHLQIERIFFINNYHYFRRQRQHITSIILQRIRCLRDARQRE